MGAVGKKATRRRTEWILEFIDMLTDDQTQGLILSLADARQEKGFEEEEAMQIVKWATETVINKSLFDNIMNGDIYVDIKDGEIVFGLTQQGKQYAESIQLPAVVGKLDA